MIFQISECVLEIIDGTNSLGIVDFDGTETFKIAFKSLRDDDEEIDEYCGPWSDLHVGGMTASVLIIIAAAMLFAAFVMQGRPNTIETSNYIAMGGGAVIIFALTFWHFMLPDAADNLDWGSGPWLAILSAGLSIAAGFIGYIRSKEAGSQEF